MDLTSFYGVVSAINFTLLGLWWVVVIEHPRLTGRDAADRKISYLITLQFAVPGIMALLSQVAPDVAILWRGAFTISALMGAVGVVMLAVPLRRENTGYQTVTRILLWAVVPLYVLIALIAAIPAFGNAIRGDLTSLQLEAILLCVMVFIGVQTAWLVAMSPRSSEDVPAED